MNGTMILPCSPRRGILISSPGREPGERPGTTDSLFVEPRKGRLSGVQPPLRGSQEKRREEGGLLRLVTQALRPGLEISPPLSGASVEKPLCQHVIPQMQDVITPQAIAWRPFRAAT